jgi:hypothetical protein
LWFMKIEEKCGFDTALKIDDQVWKVLPRIQTRMISFLSRIRLSQGNSGTGAGWMST